MGTLAVAALGLTKLENIKQNKVKDDVRMQQYDLGGDPGERGSLHADLAESNRRRMYHYQTMTLL